MDSAASEVLTGTPASRDRTRVRIVEVAAGLLASGGRDAVSTRTVAAAAGTQPPAIYRLFGDMEGLLDAVAEYGFAAYLAQKPPPEPTADPVEDLRAGWDLHVSFGLDNPALFLLMYSDTGPGHTSPAAIAARQVLRERIRRIAAAGRLQVSEDLAAEMVHAGGRGTVLTLLSMPAALRTTRLSGAMFDALVAAIVAAEPLPRAAGPNAAANALRAGLPGLTMLSSGEQHVLQEWLDRIIARPQRPG